MPHDISIKTLQTFLGKVRWAKVIQKAPNTPKGQRLFPSRTPKGAEDKKKDSHAILAKGLADSKNDQDGIQVKGAARKRFQGEEVVCCCGLEITGALLAF